ncbi:hypothetical protein VFPFJ_08639 [Purpureocillium lilacinum]|uniref:Uncharacterized protein n=1 Tax=Purpureocillium lilacinum TaxID=33203 RepID=A0A179GXY8_PURLI|nr:hypothetical protein VFPFJ_08639 [Purpureocillium lilacinum]OAQ74729.1 hypothetical protein VFPBJ_10024 [Purpureocillium lilacinum]OAQ82836.1 hypothetical protein VFPFJ_08639 [Purpureocillium lilacinum]
MDGKNGCASSRGWVSLQCLAVALFVGGVWAMKGGGSGRSARRKPSSVSRVDDRRTGRSQSRQIRTERAMACRAEGVAGDGGSNNKDPKPGRGREWKETTTERKAGRRSSDDPGPWEEGRSESLESDAANRHAIGQQEATTHVQSKGPKGLAGTRRSTARSESRAAIKRKTLKNTKKKESLASARTFWQPSPAELSLAVLRRGGGGVEGIEPRHLPVACIRCPGSAVRPGSIGWAGAAPLSADPGSWNGEAGPGGRFPKLQPQARWRWRWRCAVHSAHLRYTKRGRSCGRSTFHKHTRRSRSTCWYRYARNRSMGYARTGFRYSLSLRTHLQGQVRLTAQGSTAACAALEKQVPYLPGILDVRIRQLAPATSATPQAHLLQVPLGSFPAGRRLSDVRTLRSASRPPSRDTNLGPSFGCVTGRRGDTRAATGTALISPAPSGSRGRHFPCAVWASASRGLGRVCFV